VKEVRLRVFMLTSPFSEVQSKQHYLMVMEVRTWVSSGVEATGRATRRLSGAADAQYD